MHSPAPLLAFPPNGSLCRDLVLGMLSVKLSQRRWWGYFTCDSFPPLILHQQQLRLLSVSLAACLRLTKGAIKVLSQEKAPLCFSTSHKLLSGMERWCYLEPQQVGAWVITSLAKLRSQVYLSQLYHCLNLHILLLSLRIKSILQKLSVVRITCVWLQRPEMRI